MQQRAFSVLCLCLSLSELSRAPAQHRPCHQGCQAGFPRASSRGTGAGHSVPGQVNSDTGEGGDPGLGPAVCSHASRPQRLVVPCTDLWRLGQWCSSGPQCPAGQAGRATGGTGWVWGGVTSSLEGARLAACSRAGRGYCIRAEDQTTVCRLICAMKPHKQQLACLTGYGLPILSDDQKAALAILWPFWCSCSRELCMKTYGMADPSLIAKSLQHQKAQV